MLNPRIIILPLAFALCFGAACDEAQSFDAGQLDVGVSADASAGTDVVSSADVETIDASAAPDVVNDPDVANSPDVGVIADAGLPDLGPVQCRDSSDCQGENGSCNRAAPGGICLGCGGDCPSGTECQFGTCIRQCVVESDCSLGFQCLASGRCGLESCNEDNDCDGPYICGTNETCERPTSNAQEDCPSPLLCEASRCVEPR